MRTLWKCIWVVALAGAVGLGTGPASADSETDDIVYKMSVIADLPSSDREHAEKRFRFVLPRLSTACADTTSVTKVGDMLVAVHQVLNDSGLGRDEDLLDLTNTLFGMTTDITAFARPNGTPINCAEIWSMYVAGRQNGMAPHDARKGITSLVRTLISGS